MIVILNQPGKAEAMVEMQELMKDIPRDEREAFVRKFIKERNLLFKDILEQPQPLPNNILSIGVTTAVISATVSKVYDKVQLVYGPIQGGPYSFIGDKIKGDGTLSQPLVARITGLAPSTTYYYVLQVLNEDGSIQSQTPEASFTTISHNPRVAGATDIRTTSAILSAVADYVQLDQELRFIYGTDALDNAASVSGTNKALQKFSITPKLEPNTTYYYRVQVVGPMGVMEESEERDFTTLPYSATASVSNIHASSATISGTVDYVTADKTIELVCGGVTVISTNGNDSKSQQIFAKAALKESTSYKVKTRVSLSGATLYESEEVEFKTLSHNGSCLPATDVKACTAIVSGLVDWAEGPIELYLDDNLVAKVAGANTEGQRIQAQLMDLHPGTKYSYYLLVDGKKSLTETFITGLNSPTTLGALNVKDRTATLLGFADFVPHQGYAQFWWGRESGQKTSKSPVLFGSNTQNQEFAFMAYGLEPNTLYHYSLAVIGSDGETILDSSEEDTFKTAEAIYYRKRV